MTTKFTRPSKVVLLLLLMGLMQSFVERAIAAKPMTLFSEFSVSGIGQDATAMDVSRDGNLIAVCTNRDVSLWNSTSGRRLKLLTDGEAAGGYVDIALSPDGKFVAARSNREVDLWDVNTGKRTLLSCKTEFNDPNPFIDFVPTSDFLFTANHAWKVSNPTPIQLFKGKLFHLGRNACAAFNKQLKKCVAVRWGLDIDEGKNFLDVYIGKNIRRMEYRQPIASVSLSSDGATFAVLLNSGEIESWDVEKLNRIGVATRGSRFKALSLAFSPTNSRLLVSIHSEGPGGDVVFWDARELKVKKKVKVDAPFGVGLNSHFSEDGQFLFVGSGSGIINTTKNTFAGLASVSGDDLAICQLGEALVYRVANEIRMHHINKDVPITGFRPSVRRKLPLQKEAGIKRVAISSNGRRIAVVQRSSPDSNPISEAISNSVSEICIYEWPSCELIDQTRPPSSKDRGAGLIKRLNFTQDGKAIVYSTWGTIFLHEVGSKQDVPLVKTKADLVLLNQDGTLFTTEGKEIVRYTKKNRTVLFDMNREAEVEDMQQSPDGRWVAVSQQIKDRKTFAPTGRAFLYLYDTKNNKPYSLETGLTGGLSMPSNQFMVAGGQKIDLTYPNDMSRWKSVIAGRYSHKIAATQDGSFVASARYFDNDPFANTVDFLISWPKSKIDLWPNRIPNTPSMEGGALELEGYSGDVATLWLSGNQHLACLDESGTVMEWDISHWTTGMPSPPVLGGELSPGELASSDWIARFKTNDGMPFFRYSIDDESPRDLNIQPGTKLFGRMVLPGTGVFDIEITIQKRTDHKVTASLLIDRLVRGPYVARPIPVRATCEMSGQVAETSGQLSLSITKVTQKKNPLFRIGQENVGIEFRGSIKGGQYSGVHYYKGRKGKNSFALKPTEE